MPPTLLLRTDASPAVGVGHVMRCLALAQAWQEAGGRAVLVWAEMPAALVARLEHENFGQIRLDLPAGGGDDADATVLAARREQAEWVVVDGARFGSDYLEFLRSGGLRVMALDDAGQREYYPVDLLVNQNLAATPELYDGKVEPGVRLLLGPRYALLRREFRTQEPPGRPPARTPRRILVSFGGGDEGNVTSGVLRNLDRAARKDCEVVVLVGATNRHRDGLADLARGLGFPCELRWNVANVAEVMAWADVAITSAGSTVWELAAMRLPALVADIADGQLALLGELEVLPLFRVRKARELMSGNLEAELDALLAAPVVATGIDARGGARVVAAIRSAPARVAGFAQALSLSVP